MLSVATDITHLQNSFSPQMVCQYGANCIKQL